MGLEVAECTPWRSIGHFTGESVLFPGDVYKQRLLKGERGMVLRVSEADSSKFDL